MRKFTEPPPSSRCERCGGHLKLKRVETANTVLGMNAQVFACSKCGGERSFVAQRDLYAPQVDSGRRAAHA
jgi:Zn finger protein HypA/HybF involved in hydrogenase expression